MMKISYDKRRYAWCFMMALLTTLLVSCHERNLYQGDEEEKLDLENLFDFSTAQTVTLDVKYAVNAAKSQLDFEIYTEYPLEENSVGDLVKKTSIQPVYTGRTLEGGQLTCTINVATAAEKLYIYSPTAIAPTLVIGDIVNKQVTLVNPTDVTVSAAPEALSRASTTGEYYKNWKLQSVAPDKKLGDWDANGLPTYLLREKLELSDQFMAKLNKVLPSEDNMEATTFLYQTLTLKEEANVDMYFVSHAAVSRQNALAYYTFMGTAPTQEEINKSLTVIFPNLASSSLEQGSGVRLKYRNGTTMQENFPEGSTIGWVLLVDAYKDGDLESPCNVLYSKKAFNWYNFTTANTVYGDRPHMGAFRTDDVFVLSFEDQPWGTGRPANYRDDVFVLKTNPITALPDDVEDPDKLNIMTSKGIHAFEDNWPEKKDYDLNDVMVKYETTILHRPTVRGSVAVEFDYTFNFLHSGADYQNAFGFQITDAVLRSNIDTEATVIMTDDNFSGIGLDPDLDVATFMVFNNGKTSKDKKVTLKIKLKTPLDMENFYMSMCNPFIVVEGLNEMARTEVHLRNYKPTNKANMGLFGTKDDLSDPRKNLYYVSNDHHPFALDVRTTDEFVIPVEKEPIEYTYPEFTKWASSQGKENKEWYKHPAQ